MSFTPCSRCSENQPSTLAANPRTHVASALYGYSSTCSNQVPGYINNLDQILAKGVDAVYVVTVNDQFVCEAWKEKLGAADKTKIHFLADDAGRFTAAVGMSFDATPFLGSVRSKRYVLLVEDGIVKRVELEDDVGNVSRLSPSCCLASQKERGRSWREVLKS